MCLNKSIASSSPTVSAIMAYNKNKPMSDSSAMTSSFSKFLTMESKFFFYKCLIKFLVLQYKYYRKLQCVIGSTHLTNPTRHIVWVQTLGLFESFMS